MSVSQIGIFLAGINLGLYIAMIIVLVALRRDLMRKP